jgi:hypothetical protein
MEKKLWRNTHNAKTRRAYERVINLCGNDDAIKNAFEKYVDCIEETLQKTGWVSVEERLPEDGFEILVYTNKGATLFGEYDSSIKKFICVGFGFVDNASHWQPLPEPPK